MTETAPTHWTQFDRLYDLPDPRPYFLGVETGDYRMPAVAAQVVEALLPVLAERSANPVPRLMDFACGYGAVGLCLRGGLTMATLTDYYRAPVAEPAKEDAAHFLATQRTDTAPHHILGVDIAGVAVAYGQAVGALDDGVDANILEDPGSLAAAVPKTDLFFECGAIGDFVPDAAAAFLSQRDPEAPQQPWLLFCPRPRVAVAPLEQVLNQSGYRMETLLPKIRYRKPFSKGELAEEIESGAQNGLSAEDCLVDGYFRVDMRLALPDGEDSSAAHAAVRSIDPNGI